LAKRRKSFREVIIFCVKAPNYQVTLLGRTPYLPPVRASGAARPVGQEVQVNITAAGTNSLKGSVETL